jgi:hypothetical protein
MESPCQATIWKTHQNSVDVAAKPQHQPKKTVTSMLPQAKTPLRREQPLLPGLSGGRCHIPAPPAGQNGTIDISRF